MLTDETLFLDQKADLCVDLSDCNFFSDKKVLGKFLFFLQITRRAFQRTYSELLAHFELGDNDPQSWLKILYDFIPLVQGQDILPLY